LGKACRNRGVYRGVGISLAGKGCWNRDVGIWLLWNLARTEVAEYGRREMLLEQGCLNMVGRKKVAGTGLSNMVVGKRLLERGVGIRLSGTGCINGGVEYGWRCRILTFINLMKKIKNSLPRASNYQYLTFVFIS
jgi:hypothetical protein